MDRWGEDAASNELYPENETMLKCNPIYTEDVYMACKSGNLKRVQYLCEVQAIDLNKHDEHDAVPLFYACLCGHKAVVRYLLDSGARLDPGTYDTKRCYYGCLTKGIASILKNYKATKNLGHFAQIMKDILSNKSFSDFSFLVDNQTFKVHKFVLAARSEYLALQLCTRWKDTDCVKLKRISKEVMSAFLEYLYTEALNISTVDFDGLCALAKQCGMSDLIASLEKERQMSEGRNLDRITIHPKGIEAGSELLKAISKTYVCCIDKEDKVPEACKMYFTDVCLAVDAPNSTFQHRFYCHKALLCQRSEYFRAMLVGHFKESAEKIVTLNDIEPEVMYMVIEYLYSNDVKKANAEKFVRLLEVGQAYLIDDLRKFSIVNLCRFISDDSVIDLLRLSDMYSAVRLQDECLEYIEDQFDIMYKREDFTQFLKDGGESLAHISLLVEEYEEIHNTNSEQ